MNRLTWTELTPEEWQYFHMNWVDLSEYYRRAISKEMSIKEASDFISMTWSLLSSMNLWKHMWKNDPEGMWDSEFRHLSALSVTVWLRAQDKE